MQSLETEGHGKDRCWRRNAHDRERLSRHGVAHAARSRSVRLQCRRCRGRCDGLLQGPKAADSVIEAGRSKDLV